ncbi:MAG: hypothetical protein ACFFDU_02110 [Candidatus Thorarchaeota archaeon]
MSKKKTKLEEASEESTSEVEDTNNQLSDEEEDEIEESAKKEKAKGKKVSKERTKLSVLQAAVLETIRDRPQRPRAIQTIIRGAGGVEVPRNEILRSLNELREKGLVDKVTTKAWQAK